MASNRSGLCPQRRIGALLTLLTILAIPVLARAETAAERGAYLVRIMDCGGCHTPGALTGQPDADYPLSGGDVGFAIPDLGVFYPPNLTPDPATGLGAWAADEIIQAVRTGVRPDGRVLAPIMPWRSYAALSDADAAALVAYLKSLPARQHKVPGPFGPGEASTAPYLALMLPKTQ